jgi:type VI secretion system protein ImpE
MTSATESPPIPVPGQSFRDWSHAKPLSEALSRAEAGVRAKPQDASQRWLMFELLCVLGHWERALKQLQTWAGLAVTNDSTAHVMRGLIRAEQQRTEVFAGARMPATVLGEDAAAAGVAVVSGLAAALAQAGDKSAARQPAVVLEASDLAREKALSNARDTAGRSNLQPCFDWITDSDTRIGPVAEVILVGAYRWLPFDDIASMDKAAPGCLLDLVWSQVDIGLRNGAQLKGYMPMRYPLDADAAPGRDALLLGRETIWQDVGRTGVHARGQKMWTTDAGDMALLDLRACVFGDAAHQDDAAAGEGDADHR